MSTSFVNLLPGLLFILARALNRLEFLELGVTVMPTAWLVLAGWQDFRTRRVSDGIWYLMVAFSVLPSVTLLFIFGGSAAQFLARVATWFVQAAVFWVIGIWGFRRKIFGGADAKALGMVGLAYPIFADGLFVLFGLIASGALVLAWVAASKNRPGNSDGEEHKDARIPVVLYLASGFVVALAAVALGTIL